MKLITAAMISGAMVIQLVQGAQSNENNTTAPKEDICIKFDKELRTETSNGDVSVPVIITKCVVGVKKKD
jgi:hypothetical protein